jgi:hypothetical protein
MPVVELTVVVGTGRCGSTLLSRLMHAHPDVLSMSEFFGIVRLAGASGRSGIPVGDMDGTDLWRLLASPFPMLDAMVTAGLRTQEMRYPFGRGRFEPASGVPLISHFALPLLSEHPDALFDELAAEVPSWPRRPAAAQYLALFAYLAGRLGRVGRRVVVERSAASLTLIGALHGQFPHARFVHMYRDGPDCALSMSKHPVFRREILAMGARRVTGLPPGSTLEQVNAALPERFRGMICPPYDSARLMSHPIPVPVFGRDQWSPQIRFGVAALRTLPRGTWTQLRYEDLLRDPAAQLTTLADFIGIDAPLAWLTQARQMIDPTRPGAARTELPPAGYAALVAACAPGAATLGSAPLDGSGSR